MSQNVSIGTGRPGEISCLTGTVVRAGQIDIFQRGTHRLIGAGGRVIAILSSNQVNLGRLEGRFVTVCGIDEGQIEGVTSLQVTSVIPVAPPIPRPRPQPHIPLVLLMLLRRSRLPFRGGL